MSASLFTRLVVASREHVHVKPLPPELYSLGGSLGGDGGKGRVVGVGGEDRVWSERGWGARVDTDTTHTRTPPIRTHASYSGEVVLRAHDATAHTRRAHVGRPCSLVVLRRQATMARPAAPRWDTRPTARHTAPLAQRRVGNRLRAANLRALGSRCPHLHAAAVRRSLLLLLYHRRGNRSCAASIHPPSLEARACAAASRGAAIARVGNKHVIRVPSLLRYVYAYSVQILNTQFYQ